MQPIPRVLSTLVRWCSRSGTGDARVPNARRCWSGARSRPGLPRIRPVSAAGRVAIDIGHAEDAADLRDVHSTRCVRRVPKPGAGMGAGVQFKDDRRGGSGGHRLGVVGGGQDHGGAGTFERVAMAVNGGELHWVGGGAFRAGPVALFTHPTTGTWSSGSCQTGQLRPGRGWSKPDRPQVRRPEFARLCRPPPDGWTKPSPGSARNSQTLRVSGTPVARELLKSSRARGRPP